MSEGRADAGRIPSVDEVLRTGLGLAVIERFGRPAAVASVRATLEATRTAAKGSVPRGEPASAIAAAALAELEHSCRPKVRPVFNLTGTVLHTNLGRALLAEAAVDAAVVAMREAMALEYDLAVGKRGERDALIRELLCDLTGAEDATVVNNNAAAVLLVLNTLAEAKEAVVSRGELIEIGGSFRIPDIMARAGAKLVEVGTTNRTHESDYVGAISAATGVVLKVHTSNYRIEGFTKEVGTRALAAIAHERQVPLLHDLGSGVLVDLARWGLKREPTVAEAVADGVDVITFSGDKLLGGPQAGFIVGRKQLIAAINRNPVKRALRVDKIRLAAIEATLRLYRDPDRLPQRLPTVRFLARPKNEIEALAHRVAPVIAEAAGNEISTAVTLCSSQIGSGALPQEAIPSAGIAIRAAGARPSGRTPDRIAAAFRDLPIPVIGRIADQAFILDMRCLEDEPGFVRNLSALKLPVLEQ